MRGCSVVLVSKTLILSKKSPASCPNFFLMPLYSRLGFQPVNFGRTQPFRRLNLISRYLIAHIIDKKTRTKIFCKQEQLFPRKGKKTESCCLHKDPPPVFYENSFSFEPVRLWGTSLTCLQVLAYWSSMIILKMNTVQEEFCRPFKEPHSFPPFFLISPDI